MDALGFGWGVKPYMKRKEVDCWVKNIYIYYTYTDGTKGAWRIILVRLW